MKQMISYQKNPQLQHDNDKNLLVGLNPIFFLCDTIQSKEKN